ncbi:MAG: hypothetical protein ACT4PT_05040 [Methanobacteriota archaeon]
MNPRPRALLALAFLAPAIAGCLAAPAGPRAAADDALPSWHYRCPGAPVAGPEPCAEVISREGEVTAELTVATHPRDPRITAVAVTVGEPAADYVLNALADQSPPITGCRVAVYVTRDAGDTWTQSVPPRPALPPSAPDPFVHRCTSDPAVVFDDDGALHLAFFDGPQTARRWLSGAVGDAAGGPTGGVGGEYAHRVHFTRSTDLGGKWTEPVLLAPNGGHPWIAFHHGVLYVTWQNYEDADEPRWYSEGTSDVAWSSDAGASWTQLDPARRPRCHVPPAVVRGGDELYFACWRSTRDRPAPDDERVAFYRLEPGAATLEPRGEVILPENDIVWPFVASAPDGRLVLRAVLLHGGVFQTYISTSVDGARTWSAPLDVRDVLPETWDGAGAFVGTPGPDGSYHLLLRLYRNSEDGTRSRELRHVVLDRELLPLHARTFESWTLGAPDPAPRLGGSTMGNGLFAMAWAGDRALMAYSQDWVDGVLKVTTIEASGEG